MNNLPYVRMSICKIFADDASLFSKSVDINKSVRTPNRDSDEVSECFTPIYRIPTSSSVFIQYMKKKNLFSPSTYIEKIRCATRNFSSSHFFSYPFNWPKTSHWIIRTSIFQANFSLGSV